jgi:regulator of protease activity HflC (stomatin/prohibitin superfamily)
MRKAEKRRIAEAKREAYLAEEKARGLRALEASRARRKAEQDRIKREAQKENARLEAILNTAPTENKSMLSDVETWEDHAHLVPQTVPFKDKPGGATIGEAKLSQEGNKVMATIKVDNVGQLKQFLGAGGRFSAKSVGTPNTAR